MEKIDAYIKENLSDLAAEILDWKATGCLHGGLAINADINAAKNHEQLLPDLPRCDMVSSLSKTEGFFWKPDGLFGLDGSVLRVPDS